MRRASLEPGTRYRRRAADNRAIAMAELPDLRRQKQVVDVCRPVGHSPVLSRQQRRRRRFPRDAALPKIGSVHIGRHHRRPGHIHPDVLRLAHRQHRSLVHSLLRMHMACHGIISRKSAATRTRPVFQGNNDHRAWIPDPRHIYDGDCGLNQPHLLYFHGIS